MPKTHPFIKSVSSSDHTATEIRSSKRCRSDFVAKLATFSLEDLTGQYLSIAESHGEAETREEQNRLTVEIEMVEAVAKYRFGDAWVRP